MRASFDHIQELFNLTATVNGDVAEFGVWKGDTFLPLAKRAHALGKSSHAVDSFEGMAPPSEKDANYNGVQEYPEGALAVNGSEEFRSRIDGLSVHVWEGFVPSVLKRIPPTTRFSFVHVDLDHCDPTLDAMTWSWLRLSPGGILCSHDWFPKRDNLATAGVREFMERFKLEKTGENVRTHHVWFKNDTYVDPYSTHLAPLMALVSRTSGPVLELGCGEYSTPILHAVCGERSLVSVEHNLEWSSRFFHLKNDHHRFFAETDTKIDAMGWDVVLVDHQPAADRAKKVEQFRRAKYLVVHDTEPGRSCYNVEEVLSSFKYRVDYSISSAWTTIVSDTEPLSWLAEVLR